MTPTLTYDRLVLQEARFFEIALSLQNAGHDPNQFAHRYWRRIIEGWTVGDVIADTMRASVPIIAEAGAEGFCEPPAALLTEPGVLLTYDGFLAEQAEIAELLTVTHGGWSAGDLAHNAWRRLVEQGNWTQANLIHDILGEPLDPPPDPPKPENPNRPPAGVCRIAHRGFADDAGPFLPVVATHMDAIHLVSADINRFHDNVEYLASLGFHQRVLGILGWTGEEVDPRAPDYWSRVTYVMDYAFDRGVRTEFTVLADLYAVPDLQTHDARMRYADTVISHLQPRRHKLLCVEGCNEPGNGDLYSNYGTANELVDFIRKVGDGVGVPWAGGALYGGGGSSTAWWLPDGSIAPEAQTLIDRCPAVSMHLDRGTGAEGLWRPVRQPWEGKNTAGGKMWWDNEPVGFDSSVTWYNMGTPTCMDPQHQTLHRIAALASFMAGAAIFCWHTEGGTGYSSNRPIRGEDGGADVAAARNILPADLPNWDFHNWHWVSNPVETLEGCIYDHGMEGRGTLRTISATSGADVIVYPFCVPEGATLRAREPLYLDRYEYVHGAYTKTGELSLSAGQTWEQPAAYDTLYKGRFV